MMRKVKRMKRMKIDAVLFVALPYDVNTRHHAARVPHALLPFLPHLSLQPHYYYYYQF